MDQLSLVGAGKRSLTHQPAQSRAHAAPESAVLARGCDALQDGSQPLWREKPAGPKDPRRTQRHGP